MTRPARRAFGVALLVVAVGLLWRPASARPRRGAFFYAVDPTRPYGPSWGAERPPHLPAWARQAGVIGSAAEDVRIVAEGEGLGPTFVRVVRDLANDETNSTYGLPVQRQYDTQAWGVFQFRPIAWPDMARPQYGCAAPGPAAADQAPWEASTEDEVTVPIRMYACLWRRVTRDGGNAFDAARGVRLWQWGSSYFREYLLARDAAGSYPAAWERLRLFPINGRIGSTLDRVDADLEGLV